MVPCSNNGTDAAKMTCKMQKDCASLEAYKPVRGELHMLEDRLEQHSPSVTVCNNYINAIVL